MVPNGPNERMNIAIFRSYNGTNLVDWCKQVHAGPGMTCAPAVKTSMGPVFIFATTALKIARWHRGRSWKTCLKALKNHRDAVAAYEPLWLNKS